MVEAVQSAFRNYINFQGRARVGDFWWYVLFIVLGTIVLGILDAVLGLTAGTSYSAHSATSFNVGYNGNMGPLGGLFALATFLPTLAVEVRRLHDTDRSGWWILIALIPFVGAIVLIVFLASSGTVGANKYGPDRRNPGGDLTSVFR